MGEEMLLDKERDMVTKHEKIYISQPQEFDPARLRKEIKSLERSAELMDSAEVIRKMKEIIG